MVLRFGSSCWNLRELKSELNWQQVEEEAVFQFGGPNCRVCRLIRVYLLVAIPVLMMMWIRPDFKFRPVSMVVHLWVMFLVLVSL